MNGQLAALAAELQKNKSARMVWGTGAAFALAPVMGGVFMMILQDPEATARAGTLRAKAQMMSFTVNWVSYLGILSQAMGVGGILVFGFVASWLFGREYSDGTAKDLLALPTSRTEILNAKFICYVLWCGALAVSNLLLGLVIGAVLGLPGWNTTSLLGGLQSYLVTTALTVALGSPVAFFALWGRGYLAPLGAVALTLVLAQIIAAIGAGAYFPWAIPGLYSAAGDEYRAQLDAWSYLVLILTGTAGYLATVLWWRYADQAK